MNRKFRTKKLMHMVLGKFPLVSRNLAYIVCTKVTLQSISPFFSKALIQDVKFVRATHRV